MPLSWFIMIFPCQLFGLFNSISGNLANSMKIKKGYDFQYRTECRNASRELGNKFVKSHYREIKYEIGGRIEGKHPPFRFTAGGKDMLAGSTHLWENQPEVVHMPL